MAYNKTIWVNNNGPHLNATNLNKIEQGIADAHELASGGAVDNHIIPTENEAFDLGSPERKFRDLYLSGNTMYLGEAQVSSTETGALNLPADSRINGAQIPPTNLVVEPEVLEINVNAEGEGQDVPWLWTWGTSSLAYSRIEINNEFQPSVPLYEQGVYTLNNFSMVGDHSGLSQGHGISLKWVEGAGNENNVPWVTDQGMGTHAVTGINDGLETTVHTKLIEVPSFATMQIPTSEELTPPNVSYDVSVDGGFFFEGAASGANVSLGPWYRGGTYTFNIYTPGHPMYLTTDNGANFQMGTFFGEYTDGVTGSRTENGTMTITVPMDAPDELFYQCGNHAGMRGLIRIKDLEVERNAEGNVIVYAQHGQEGMVTPVILRPIPELTTQMCIVYDKDTQRFVPQDLITYIERTPGFANKIREIAGTATLTVAEGTPVVSTVRVVADASYLPYAKNNVGDLAYDKDGDRLFVWEGTEWVATTPGKNQVLNLPYDMGFYVRGPVLHDEVVAAFVTTRDMTVPAGATSSVAKVTNLLSARCVLDILVEGTEIGTVTFENGNYSGDFNISEDREIPAGSIVSLRTDPNSQVVNENMVITIVGFAPVTAQ